LRVLHEIVVRLGLLTLVLLMTVAGSVRGGSANGPEPLPASPIGADCRQLLLVRAASWTVATGSLERFERTEGSTWTPIGAAIPVDIGRNGMAWGRGLQRMTTEAGPVKREGDGKSPAGVYRLGTAFGVAVSLPTRARGFPYQRALPTTYCVEDPRSVYYNQIVDSTRVKPSSWEQWSQMARADGLFDWGVVVQQNAPATQKGSGSCVFLHVWRGPKRPTAGCTAMARDQIEETLRWLDPDLGPVLVQLPESVFRSVRAVWGLPQGLPGSGDVDAGVRLPSGGEPERSSR
jgi:L,D-peptidoglycan transpeptidase YkuD (ErfK/YbiS/YcfS/YnhG family)